MAGNVETQRAPPTSQFQHILAILQICPLAGQLCSHGAEGHFSFGVVRSYAVPEAKTGAPYDVCLVVP